MLIPGVSGSLLPLREIVPDTQAKAGFLWKFCFFLSIVHDTIWNFTSTCLHVFLLSWLDCKHLKSKEHVCLNSLLQPHCPAQGLTHVQMCRNNVKGVKSILENLEDKRIGYQQQSWLCIPLPWVYHSSTSCDASGTSKIVLHGHSDSMYSCFLLWVQRIWWLKRVPFQNMLDFALRLIKGDCSYFHF